MSASIQTEGVAAPRPTMSSHRLLICLSVLGWSVRELARRMAQSQSTVARWAGGTVDVPWKVAAWLEVLVAFHLKNPAPRMIVS